jgi:hypothetical protein
MSSRATTKKQQQIIFIPETLAAASSSLFLVKQYGFTPRYGSSAIKCMAAVRRKFSENSINTIKWHKDQQTTCKGEQKNYH